MGIAKNILYKVANKKYLPKFKNQSVFPYYHLVSDSRVDHIEHLYTFKNHARFQNDVKILTDNYKPIDPEDLLKSNSVNPNGFLISFDDGLQEIYTVVYPILKEKNIKAIFFINPNFVDNNEGFYKHYISIIIAFLKRNRFEKNLLKKVSKILSFNYKSVNEFKQKLINIKFSEKEKIDTVLKALGIDAVEYLKEHKPYLTKEQIQEMINNGFYFGGHTMGHPPLNSLSHKEQREEIISSINWIKEHFGVNYSFFSFPFSDKSISKKLLEELFKYDTNIRLFGNSGLKKDIDSRIIQRFSLENPDRETEKSIVTENLYKYFNKAIRKYHIKRQ